MALYWRYIKAQVRIRTEYRVSFAFLVLSMAAIPLLELLGITLMFERFGNIRGWTFYEVLLAFAVINFGSAAGELFFRGFDHFDRMVRNAGFDRLLLRPRSLVLQVLGSDFDIGRLGRIAAAVYFLWLALINLPVERNARTIFTLLLMLAGAGAVFAGVQMMRAALCFWTIEGLEVVNIVEHGGRTAMQYPVSIYNKVFRMIFTVVVPFAAANYYPMLVLLHKTDGRNGWYALMPLLGFVFLLPCYMLWRVGVRHYASTGS